jgi:hypothetical protein
MLLVIAGRFFDLEGGVKRVEAIKVPLFGFVRVRISQQKLVSARRIYSS